MYDTLLITEADRVVTVVVNRPAKLNALNARLRDDYIHEIQGGLDRWNRIPEKFGLACRFTLPHLAFHRKIGNFANHHITPTTVACFTSVSFLHSPRLLMNIL